MNLVLYDEFHLKDHFGPVLYIYIIIQSECGLLLAGDGLTGCVASDKSPWSEWQW